MSVVFPYLVLNDAPEYVADTRLFGVPKIAVKPRMVVVKTTKRGTSRFIIFRALAVILFAVLLSSSAVPSLYG